MIIPSMPPIFPGRSGHGGGELSVKEMVGLVALAIVALCIGVVALGAIIDWTMCSPRCTLLGVIMNKLRFISEMRLW